MQSNYGAIPELPCAVPELYRGSSGIGLVPILRLTYTCKTNMLVILLHAMFLCKKNVKNLDEEVKPCLF